MSANQQTALIQEPESLPADAPPVLLSTGKLVREGFDHAPLDALVLEAACQAESAQRSRTQPTGAANDREPHRQAPLVMHPFDT